MLTGCSQAVLDSHLGRERNALTKGRVLYYGVDIPDLPSCRQRAELRESFGWETDSPVIIHVGSFTEQKNHLGVLSIFERVVGKIQSAKLLLVGDGPMRPKVEKFIKDRCHFHSVCLLGLRDDVPQLMALSDILVFPSLHEGFGIVGLEASAVGKPVVASRVGGIVEAVVDGQTGILHDVNDIEGMAESVCKILDDSDYRRQLGQAGRERVQKQFSLQVAADNLLRLYHDCLGGS
jgi:glycosyltransferase involved in cell wall biosynthesis